MTADLKEETIGGEMWIGIRSHSSEWSWFKKEDAIILAKNLYDRYRTETSPHISPYTQRRIYGWRSNL